MIRNCQSLGVSLLVFFTLVPQVRSQETTQMPRTIEWHGSEGCEDRAQLYRELETLLDWEIIANTEMRFSGSATSRGSVWEARLETTAEEEKLVRTVSVGSCASAQKVVALLIALTLDPMAALSADKDMLEAIESSAEVEPGGESVESGGEGQISGSPEGKSIETNGLSDDSNTSAEPQTVVESENIPGPGGTGEEQTNEKGDSSSQDSEKSKPLWGLRLSALADFGTVPRFGIGFSVGGEIRIGILYGTLGLRFVPPRKTVLANFEQAELRTWLLSTVAGVGGVIHLSSWTLIPKIGIFFQTIGSETSGIVKTRSDRTYFFAPWLGLAVDWNITAHLGLFLTPAVHFSILPPTFKIEGSGTVHKVSVVSASLEFGIFFIF